MKRRDLLKLGASVAAAPSVSLAQQKGLPASTKTAGEWKPELLDDHQNQTLIALVDLIIPATDTPGAKAALVNRHLDHLLAAAPVEDKTKFREGLWWIDGYAIRKHGKPFASCAPAEQVEMLQSFDAGTAGDVEPGHQFFGMLKQATAEIYYATQIGFNELNKSGVPSSFACTHPEHA